jgi:hypothetical protein
MCGEMLRKCENVESHFHELLRMNHNKLSQKPLFSSQNQSKIIDSKLIEFEYLVLFISLHWNEIRRYLWFPFCSFVLETRNIRTLRLISFILVVQFGFWIASLGMFWISCTCPDKCLSFSHWKYWRRRTSFLKIFFGNFILLSIKNEYQSKINWNDLQYVVEL